MTTYIQIIIAKAPQPSELVPTKKSGRNIKGVPKKRRKGRTPTRTFEPNLIVLSLPAPELVVLSPLNIKPIYETKNEPQHKT